MKQFVRARTTLPRDVVVLGLIAFCVAVGFGVLIPVLPVFAKSFQVDNTSVGLVVSAFALMRLVTSPFCGRIGDLLGGKVTLAIGVFIVAATSSLAAFSQTFWQLLVFRGLGGVGSAMFTVSAMAVLMAAVEPRMRGRASGFFQGGFLLGGMLGPALGGLVSKVSVTAPFHFYAITLAVAGCVGLALLRTQGRVSRDDRAGRASMPIGEAARDVRFQAACLSAVGQGWNAFGIRNSLTPTLVVEVLHRDASWTGISFAVAAVVQTIALSPAGRFVDTVGRRPAMVAAGTIGGLAMLGIPFAPNIWVLMALLAMFGLAAAMLGTAPTAAVGDVTRGRGGTPIAVFSMSSDLGAIIGPVAAGFLADHVSMNVAFAVGAAILLLSAAYALRMPSGVPSDDDDPTDPAKASA
ncbi:MFS transporter [Mariniluteicoccus endophyticus]